jgi:hypothetical protein
MVDSGRTAQLVARAHHGRAAAECRLHLVQRPDHLDAAGRADVGERDVGELARGVGEDADARTGGVEAAKDGPGVAVRPEVDRAAIGGEALEQRPLVAELLVQPRRGRDAVARHVEVDVRAPRGVVEPVEPELPGVREDGVELDGECLHRHDARLAASYRRAVRELRCKAGTVPPL